MTRTLLLLRHGKAAYPGGVADHERPIADRGRRESALAGDWIRETQPAVDAVLCSDAVRTRQTLEATGIDAPTEYTRDVYEASPDEILGVVQQTGDDVDTLLVVGHGPGIPGLAVELAADDSDRDALDETARHFPTSTVAVLRFDGPWTGLRHGGARLDTLHVSRAPE